MLLPLPSSAKHDEDVKFPTCSWQRWTAWPSSNLICIILILSITDCLGRRQWFWSLFWLCVCVILWCLFKVSQSQSVILISAQGRSAIWSPRSLSPETSCSAAVNAWRKRLPLRKCKFLGHESAWHKFHHCFWCGSGILVQVHIYCILCTVYCIICGFLAMAHSTPSASAQCKYKSQPHAFVQLQKRKGGSPASYAIHCWGERSLQHIVGSCRLGLGTQWKMELIWFWLLTSDKQVLRHSGHDGVTRFHRKNINTDIISTSIMSTTTSTIN